MSTQGTLQNQKYQTCIDACNDCAEACEYCATCDLQEQDVKAMATSTSTKSAKKVGLPCQNLQSTIRFTIMKCSKCMVF